MLSLSYGPTIQRRSGSKATDHKPDAGMFVNARAFRKAVDSVLKRALQGVGGVVMDPVADARGARTKGGQTESKIS